MIENASKQPNSPGMLHGSIAYGGDFYIQRGGQRSSATTIEVHIRSPFFHSLD
jgi:hypothetical protein